MALKTILTLLAAMQAVKVLADSSHPLHMRKVDAHTAHAMLNAKGLAASRDGALYNEQGFWFSHFSIGGSPDLQILIDTGSSDTILNPGVYQQSSTGADTGRTFRISYATTNPDGSGQLSASGEVYTDVVSQLGTDLTVANQAIGDIRRPTSPPTFPHDGLIGYAGADGAALQSSPFFQSLCDQGTLTSCRFGLSLRTNSTGTLHYGAVATGDFSGSLVNVPATGEWSVQGDITVNGKVVSSRASIITDSGTTVVFGPTSAVKSVFKAAGIQAVSDKNGVTGYYACDKSPKIGISFNGQNFNIEPSALAFSRNGNNCTASVHGSDSFGGQWLVGQAWFQGKYIDHNVDDSTMGFATLN